jgi:peptide/nickel transport system permease protein
MTIDPLKGLFGGRALRSPVHRELADRRPAFRRLLRDRLGLVGLCVVVVLITLSIAAPLIARQDPTVIDAVRRLQPASHLHPLGTDNLGRDVLSRLLYGSRWSLGTVAIATLLILSIGITVGTVAGYFGGVADEILMRIVDVLLAFPSLLLALAVVGMLGPGLLTMMIGVVSVWWASYARLVRGIVLSIRHREFVVAARSLGASDRRIIFKHILPNVLPPVAVLATIEMGELILAVSGLGFLGLGAQPPTPEWGNMVNDGRFFLLSAPRLMIYPGVAISIAVIGFNLLGDGLRDVLDPRSTASTRHDAC